MLCLKVRLFNSLMVIIPLNFKFYSLKPSNALWWFFRGCSPLPIPNREVKPLMADGTAQQCGRVGSCHIHLKKPFRKLRGFFVLYQEVGIPHKAALRYKTL